MPQIKGKVADIMDEYTLVINRGSKDGVEEGMRFMIYEEGKEIKDPESNETLGKFEFVKRKVRIDVVNEKFSTGKSYEQIVWGGPLTGYGTVRLPLDESMKKTSGKTRTDVIRIGDLVKQIID